MFENLLSMIGQNGIAIAAGVMAAAVLMLCFGFFKMRSLGFLYDLKSRELENLSAECEILKKNLKNAEEHRHQLEIDAARLRTEIEQQDQLADRLNLQLNSWETKYSEQLDNNRRCLVEIAELRNTNRNLSEKLAQEDVRLKQLYEQFMEKVTNATNKIVNEGRRELFDTNKNSMDSIVNPMIGKIQEFQNLITRINAENIEQRTRIADTISVLTEAQNKLYGEAEKLANALHYEKKQQGMWGELVLQDILDTWGLRENEEYVREFAVKGSESETGEAQRPDFVLNLPDNRHLLIDAKCPINAYRDYVNTDDPAVKSSKLKELVSNIKARINELSAREYHKIKTLNSPDFVFLFIPIEPAYIVATAQDPRLNLYAFERRIALTTPSTIMAALFITKQMWVAERQNENVEKVKSLLLPLCRDLEKFTEKYSSLGDTLNVLQRKFDDGRQLLTEKRGSIGSQKDFVLETFGRDNTGRLASGKQTEH